MKSFRNILFQIHLWMGLIVGLFFILLGLSGSALVYPQLLTSSAAMPAATGQGAPLPPEKIIAAALASAPQNAGRDATLTLPRQAGDVATVQFSAQRNFAGQGRGGRRGGGRPGAGGGDRAGAFAGRGAQDRGGQDRDGQDRGGPGRDGARGGDAGGGRGGRGGPAIFVDPVSGAVLAGQMPRQSALLGLAHQMHESMLLGGPGRSFVGWLGIGMTFLGLSGLYLWWPKSGQWKYAFGVRRSARGARLYREIHGMLGIWFWIVFVVVSVTGVLIVFPGLMGGGRPDGPPPGFTAAATPQAINVPPGATRLPLNTILQSAEKSSQGKAAGLTVPAQMDHPVTVRLANGDEDGPPRSVMVNPYTGAAIAQPAASRPQRPQTLNARSLHQGEGLGPVWRFLVFLSGFLPLIFVTTGFLMWIKKRQARGAVAANRA